ncbi:MAG: hypothetical protein L6Q95_04560 [Planctomycetes bacterium]|nr:hypothetical protein [Planctomycetota bacterium]
MGAVAEVLSRRERQKPPKRGSWWVLLWIATIVPAFVYGGYILIASAGFRWLRAILWAGYGALFLAAAFALDRVVWRLRGRPDRVPAWGTGRPLRIVAFCALYCTGLALVAAREVWGFVLSAVVAESVLTLIDRLASRRAAAPGAP